MGEDRPLTAFTDESDDSKAAIEGGRDAPNDGQRSSSSPPDSTYRWEPSGAVCERCGTTTERQWIDDGEFVCPACKRWD